MHLFILVSCTYNSRVLDRVDPKEGKDLLKVGSMSKLVAHRHFTHLCTKNFFCFAPTEEIPCGLFE